MLGDHKIWAHARHLVGLAIMIQNFLFCPIDIMSDELFLVVYESIGRWCGLKLNTTDNTHRQ
ncbi:hypothetical protein L873DRAFT_1809844 [Choiromyces venosus 120613-1]|uniref:Uncharacterized protein n=1 Tax=Choiromyces venosus 120613-1 TaxID=1336337 RepID=A0A3N4JGD0_9PEZI|nr:hypothetical protein L873DRAFT_1809844 [Choiromyces venosus 120613-1]